MKKILFYATLAGLVLTGCSKSEYLGVKTEGRVAGEISFSMQKLNLTKADHAGAAAAALLNNNFVVEGIKGDGSTQTEVFDHYNVNYTASTANTTESNTANWEYVGQTQHSLSAASAQTIKYWDYSASQYDFVAFSYGTSDDTELTLSDIDYAQLGEDVDGTPVYTVEGSAEELAKAYIADLITVYNRDGVSEFGKSAVTPRFRSLGTKVRVAFYETVPGYSVTNLKFYDAAWDGSTATSAAGADNATLFAANAIFPSATSTGTMSVYYPTVGWDNSANDGDDPDYNQAHITFAAGTGTGVLVKTKIFGALANMAAAEDSEAAGNIYLGRTSKTATYAGDVTAAAHAYQIVLPLGTKDNLQIRVEYDLVPTDGAEEVIHVRDARAVVPAAYADWKPNYAYTYIFKISDATNGWTGVDGDDNVVEGITPITFDAVVVDTEEGVQETITTIATPSITTYQEGVVVTAGSEYEAGYVYASVMNGTTAVDLSSLSSPAGVAVYVATATDPSIITETLVQDQLNGTKNNTGITLASCGYSLETEVPTADGNTVAVSACKFYVASGKTYVFQYSDGSKNYVKVIKVQ